MKRSTAQVYRQSITLAAQNAHTSWARRDSVLLRLCLADYVGYGEACPLPTVSPESASEAAAWLGRFSVSEDSLLAASGAWDLLPRFALELESAPSSARYAAELALLDIYAQRRNEPLWRVLAELTARESQPSESQPSQIFEQQSPALVVQAKATPPAAQLFHVWGEDYRERFEQLLATSVQTLKVKVGRDVTLEAARLSQLHKSAPLLRWRLDANQSLLSGQLETLLGAFAELEPEFIEEPCPPSNLGRPRPLPIPLAFDETLFPSSSEHTELVENWLECGAVRALVLKPMVLGGVERILKWVSKARRSKAQVIFSHVFDGAVAFRSYCQWQAAVGSRSLAPGLGSHAGQALWQTLPSREPSPMGPTPTSVRRS